jgi:hypothetical protein
MPPDLFKDGYKHHRERKEADSNQQVERVHGTSGMTRKKTAKRRFFTAA